MLELACGTGRLSNPLARAGRQIVGIDLDPTMLAAARRRRHGYEWPLYLASDMRRFALAARFRLVFVAYNSLQLLDGPQDMAACLDRARHHLAPGGLIGAEVTDFQAGGADGPTGGRGEALGQADGISLSGTLAHHLATRTSHYHRSFAGDGWSVEDDVVVRSVDPGELEAVLRLAGLDARSWWLDGPVTRALAAPR